MSDDDLPKYTLTKNDNRGGWDLRKDGGDRARAHFDTKAEATAGGALASALGAKGGSVKIQKEDGRYQEERTFPREKDPSSSKG